MDLTDPQTASIVVWGTSNPLILAIHLFGSRAKGTSRPDSDVDLALTIDDPDPVRTFLLHGEQWQDELRAATGLLVNIEINAGARTPLASAIVAENGIELFSQNAQGKVVPEGQLAIISATRR